MSLIWAFIDIITGSDAGVSLGGKELKCRMSTNTGVDGIQLARNREKCRPLGNTVMNLWVFEDKADFLTS